MKRSPPDHKPLVKQVRRVLIGMGSAGAAAQILDMASELAVALEAELAGLFVEEELLYQISELPTFSAIGGHGQVMQKMDRQSISRVIARHALACRRALLQRAERNHLRWSYDVEPGEALSVIGAHVKSDDILIVTGTATSTTARAKMELATQMRAVPGANLIVPDIVRTRSGPVALLHPEHDRHIYLAKTVAESLGEPLVTIAPDNKEQLQPNMPHGRFFSDPAQLVPVLSSLQPRLLVASHSDMIFTDMVKAGELLRNLGAPILLVNF